jgi:hypothetical protein
VVLCRGGNGDGALDERHGRGGPPALVGDQAQQMQGVGITGLAGEDVAIDRLRLCQPPGGVMLHRACLIA